MIVHVVTPDNYWPLPWVPAQVQPGPRRLLHDAAAWSPAAARSPPPSVVILTEDVRPRWTRACARSTTGK